MGFFLVLKSKICSLFQQEEHLTYLLIDNRIRLSGTTESSVYEGLTGGIMPFWSSERLSDSELKDLVAYTFGFKDEESDKIETLEGEDSSVSSAQSNCTSTNPLVGKTLTLSERYHDVKGTAEILDDCTKN